MAKWFVCYLSKKNILFAKNIFLYFKSRKELIVYLIITFTQYSEI